MAGFLLNAGLGGSAKGIVLPGVAAAVGVVVLQVNHCIVLRRVVGDVIFPIAGEDQDSDLVAAGSIVPHIIACTNEDHDAAKSTAGVVIAESAVIGPLQQETGLVLDGGVPLEVVIGGGTGQSTARGKTAAGDKPGEVIGSRHGAD